jgi:hypothetical protein
MCVYVCGKDIRAKPVSGSFFFSLFPLPFIQCFEMTMMMMVMMMMEIGSVTGARRRDDASMECLRVEA